MNSESWILLLVCCFLMACCEFPVAADETIAFSRVAPIFKKHCHGCHGPAKSKGDLRLDKLNPDLVGGNDGDQWREVLDRLNFGDMPPETEPPLARKDRETLTQWLVQESLPPTKHAAHQDWHWFPHKDGSDYQLTSSLEPLEPHRKDMTILGGLSHPASRKLVGHNTGDIWLSGADIRLNLNNSISLDQLIARQAALHTRVPSLVLSSNGGVGIKSRTTTISFDGQGRAIPAESNPRRIFERLFERPGESDQAARERALTSGRRRVDFLLEDARSLRQRLGNADQQRLDEFLQSLSEVERRLIRAEDWLDKALPEVDRSKINLDVSQKGPSDYIRTMLDLIVLAFQTDTTRVATYQIGAEDGVGVCDRFPSILGFGNGHHGLSHGTGKPDGYKKWGEYDRFLAEQFSYFLTRLASVREGNSRILDNTFALFGSGTSTTHNARNYPLVLAGGRNMGIHHGRFIRHSEERALGDLYLTMLHRLDIPARSFAENAGEFSELLRPQAKG